MAEFNFSLTDGNQDELMKMNKTLNWLMQNLDHANVKRLYTEYCNIQSENGETVINGPLIKMTTGSTTLRLKMGKEGSAFTFALYNNAGVQTVGIDSLGNGTFTGEITGSVITGGTIQTSTSGAKIVINSSGINFYDSSGVIRSSFKLVNFFGVDYYPLKFNNESGTEIGTIYASGSELSVYGNSLYLSGNPVDIYSGTAVNILNAPLYVNRIEGYSNADIIYLGSGNSRVDVAGGSLRLKNANGAYLLIEDSNVTFYDSLGGAHTIV